MNHMFVPWGFQSNGRTVKNNGFIGKQGIFRKHLCRKCGKTHGQGKMYITARSPEHSKIFGYRY